MTKKVYVGNLPYSTTEEELKAYFEEDGRQVSEVAIIMDRETGRPRGFAFVTFASEDDARSAVEALDGSSLGGRTLRVNESQDKRGGGGGGRGRGRGGGGFREEGGGYPDRDGGGRGGRRGGGRRDRDDDW